MRIFALVFAFMVGLAALTFAVSDASAKTITVKLTQQQVANVCGDRVETGGGHSGCSKPCGNGKHICGYDCNNKTKECGGQCLTCPQRKFPWGDNYSSHVVTKAMKAVQ